MSKARLDIPNWVNNGYERHIVEEINKEEKRKLNKAKQEERKEELYNLLIGILAMVLFGLVVLVVGYVEGSL